MGFKPFMAQTMRLVRRGEEEQCGNVKMLRGKIATEAQQYCASMPHKRYKSFVEFIARRGWGLREGLLAGTRAVCVGTLRSPMFSQWDFAGHRIKFIILKALW